MLIPSLKLLVYVIQPAPKLIYICCACFHPDLSTSVQQAKMTDPSDGSVNGRFSNSSHLACQGSATFETESKLHQETGRVCASVRVELSCLYGRFPTVCSLVDPCFIKLFCTNFTGEFMNRWETIMWLVLVHIQEKIKTQEFSFELVLVLSTQIK